MNQNFVNNMFRLLELLAIAGCLEPCTAIALLAIALFVESEGVNARK